MKICIIGDAGHINLLSWVNYLVKQGDHKIHIFTFNNPCEQIENVHVHILKSVPFFSKTRYVTATPYVKRQLRLIKPDIVIGYRINSYGLMAVMAGFRPVVVIAQGSDIFYPKKSILNDFIVRYVIKKADLVHTWGKHMGDKLLQYGAITDKLLILPKGIDTERFMPVVRQIADETFTLITTRQLRKSYNHEVILHAISATLEKIPKLQYLICGEGEHKSELERLANRLGIEKHVKFIGHVSHNSLSSYLASSHAYVSMQPSDGVSASLLESMSCGVFPIVTDNEANRLWIKDGVNGFLVPIDDCFALSMKIISAFENPALRKEAKFRNRALIEGKASMTHNIEKTLSVYSKLIKPNQPNN